jgi:hypothetical protein
VGHDKSAGVIGDPPENARQFAFADTVDVSSATLASMNPTGRWLRKSAFIHERDQLL